MNTDKKISLGLSIGGGVFAVSIMLYIIYDIYRENKKVSNTVYDIYRENKKVSNTVYGDLATKLESKYPRREKLDDNYSLDNPRSNEGGKRHRKTRGKKRRNHKR
jgi:hypothetical protein